MGSVEKSYIALSIYCYVLEQKKQKKKNYNDIIDIVIDCDCQFKFFFMFIVASLVGFCTSIRLVITFDGNFFKSKVYKDFIYHKM